MNPRFSWGGTTSSKVSISKKETDPPDLSEPTAKTSPQAECTWMISDIRPMAPRTLSLARVWPFSLRKVPPVVRVAV